MVQPVSSDRMALLFAAAHESVCGRFRKRVVQPRVRASWADLEAKDLSSRKGQ